MAQFDLDHPVQHTDDYRALNLVEVLAAISRSGRQIIVAVEDAALADLLCRRLRSKIDELGRRFDLQTSKSGSAEIASTQDINGLGRLVRDKIIPTLGFALELYLSRRVQRSWATIC